MTETPDNLTINERHELVELHELFRVLRDGVVLCDADLRIVRVNDAFLKMFNRSLRDLQGCVADDAFYLLSIFGSQTRFWRRLQETGRYEMSFRNPSGRRHFHITGTRIAMNGRGGYALVLHETTAQDAMHERALEAEKLKALAQVLSKMANQLNNPLQSVIGFADMLERNAGDPNWMDNVRVIQRESRRTAHTLKSLLLYSRRLRPEPARLNVNPFVESTVREWQSQSPSPRIELALSLPTESPQILGDAFQLEQVFRHLLNHAHQAVAIDRPAIGPAISVSVARAEDRIEFTVAHNGPALPRQKLRRIFEPDFQQPSESRETGLELAVCRDVVRAHGGRILCQSEAGVGTRFVFALPTPITNDTTLTARASLHSVPTTRVMVIDDEPSIGVLLREVLSVENYEPECFTSAREALRRLDEAQFDVILCDINMPEMNGKEFYRQLESRKPAQAERVVFATGDLLSDHPDLFHEGHRHDVLPKPFKLDQLLLAIQRKLRRAGAKN